MKDLSIEEKLRQIISEKEDIFDEEQWKRCKITFFVLSGVIYCIALVGDIINSTAGIFLWLVIAPFIAVAVMYISFMILVYITNGIVQRVETIARLQGRLDEIEFNKYSDHESEKTKEIKLQLNRLKDLLEITFDECNLDFDGDFENEEDEEKEEKEEIEIIKNQLESLKGWVKLIETEYKYLKLIKVFDDEVE